MFPIFVRLTYIIALILKGCPKLVGPRASPKGIQTLICPNTLIPFTFQKIVSLTPS